MDEREVYKQALDKWGAEAQICMVFEEMAELQKELCKALRGKENRIEIAEELADVAIRLADLCGGIGIDLESEIEQKMEKNRKREYKHGKAF